MRGVGPLRFGVFGNTQQLTSFGVSILDVRSALQEGRSFPVPGGLCEIFPEKINYGTEDDPHYHIKLTIKNPTTVVQKIATRPKITVASTTKIFEPVENVDDWCYGEIEAAEIYGAFEFRLAQDLS